MARPSKPVALSPRGRTKQDISTREEIEKALTAGGDPVPPGWLTEDQKEIFRKVVKSFSGSGILSAGDCIALALYSIATDRLRYIEMKVNEDPSMLTDRAYLAARSSFEQSFHKGMVELCIADAGKAQKLTEDDTGPLARILDDLREV